MKRTLDKSNQESQNEEDRKVFRTGSKDMEDQKDLRPPLDDDFFEKLRYVLNVPGYKTYIQKILLGELEFSKDLFFQKQDIENINQNTIENQVLIGKCRACTCSLFSSSPLHLSICTCGHFTAAHLNPITCGNFKPPVINPIHTSNLQSARPTYRASSSEMTKWLNNNNGDQPPIYEATKLKSLVLPGPLTSKESFELKAINPPAFSARLETGISDSERLKPLTSGSKPETSVSRRADNLNSLDTVSTNPPSRTVSIIGACSSSSSSNLDKNTRKPNEYSAAEKESMVNFLLENFPKIEPKVLYLSLRHYHFNMNSFFEDYNMGKVNFIDLEKRYLLEEYATVKNRLDELERINNPKPPSPDSIAHNKEDEYIQESIDELNEKHAQSEAKYEGTIIPKPSYWDLTKVEFALIPVVLHSEEGLKVLQRFYENDQKSRQVFEIKSVVRIQNSKLFDHYYISQSTLVKRNKKSNEKALFHGCASGAIQSIASTGFDIRMSSFKGAAGVGIYFAQFPRTSLSYIRDCPPTEMKILLCRVELGVATTIPELHKAFPFASPSNPIRRPHARSITDPTLFDSVHGLMRDDVNHPIHVVYDNYQIYPEYIITFSINENKIVRGKPPSAAPAINYEHPRYRTQLEETKKSLKFLERTLLFEPNRGLPDYSILERLHSLLKTPPEKGSVHDTDNINLEGLQHLVRHYNQLCANFPIILLPKETSFVELSSSPVMPAQPNPIVSFRTLGEPNVNNVSPTESNLEKK